MDFQNLEIISSASVYEILFGGLIFRVKKIAARGAGRVSTFSGGIIISTAKIFNLQVRLEGFKCKLIFKYLGIC